MNPFASYLKRHRPIVFFLLAYALSWAIYPMLTIAPMLGLLALFGPAIAAILTGALAGGGAELTALFRRLGRWRVPLLWYAVASCLPLLLGLAAALLNVALGEPFPTQLAPVGSINIILFFLVVGEEIGWRGYALPKLLENR